MRPKFRFIYMFVLGFVVFELQAMQPESDDPDIGWSPENYIRRKGYVSEVHYVTTSDKYIITVYRVRNSSFYGPLQPCMLVHGVFLSSMAFLTGSSDTGTVRLKEINYDTGQEEIIQKPSANLGFALADQGYDVWLPSMRGTTYSTNHSVLDPFKDSEYWDFTVQEMVKYDLPAIIYYIQKKSGKREIGYVGHSQGTVVVLWLLAERPEYSNILNPVVLLAPIMEAKDFKNQVWVMLGTEIISKGLAISNGPLLVRSSIMDKSLQEVCTVENVAGLCLNSLKMIGQFDSPQLNQTRLGVYAHYFPAGASRKQIAHFFQVTKYDSLRYYDEGPVINMEKYGRPDAPHVPWESINSTTLVAFWSSDDSLANEDEVQVFKKAIKVKLMENYRVPYDLFSHMDFVLGIDAGRLINTRIIRIMNKYYGNQAFYRN